MTPAESNITKWIRLDVNAQTDFVFTHSVRLLLYMANRVQTGNFICWTDVMTESRFTSSVLTTKLV